ncbi:hypothetical protein ABZ951_25415 [Streptomyces sp. NPDC046215]
MYRSTNRPYKDRNIYWVWGHNLNPGDKVSLDWTDDYAKTYHACHATVPQGKHDATTGAVDNPQHRLYRVCIKRVGHAWECGGRWQG